VLRPISGPSSRDEVLGGIPLRHLDSFFGKKVEVGIEGIISYNVLCRRLFMVE
jgi:hypothetical protein